MIKKYLGFFLFALVAITICSCSKQDDPVDSNGKKILLSEYQKQGKWVMVNYWATWCKPCIMELPELNVLAEQHADKLVVIGVNFDGIPNAEINQFSAPLHISFPLLNNFPKERFAIQDIPSVPATFLISPQGKVVKTLYGPQTQNSILSAIEMQE